MDVKIIETTSNSVQLSWISGSNGGENATYVITISNIFNLTTIIDEEEDVSNIDSSTETKFNMIEIRGLQSNRAYEFKIMAYNSMGSSDYTQPIGTVTQRTHLKADALPSLTNAQFNEQREAICFDLDSMASLFGKEEEKSGSKLTNNALQSSYKSLNELLVRIEIDLNDDFFNEFVTTNRSNNNDLFLMENSYSSSSSYTKKSGKNNGKKTYLVNLNRLKYGQNCISYSQLMDVDFRLRNTSRDGLVATAAATKKQPNNVYTLDSATAMLINDQLTAATNVEKTMAYSKYSNVLNNDNDDDSSNLVGYDFHEFIRMHRVNVSLCYANDSSICSKKIGVSGNNLTRMKIFVINNIFFLIF